MEDYVRKAKPGFVRLEGEESYIAPLPEDRNRATIEQKYNLERLRENGVTIGGDNEHISFICEVQDLGDEAVLITTEDTLVDQYKYPRHVAQEAMHSAARVLNDYTILNAMRNARVNS